ncbi:hypothetical protein B0H63DRAFT_174412 [Podospora didyma]|uniref:HNH domain-containing protein n=1 Tax=Podospora didyma TaxID=330526 RepID=A0AAE0NNR9_9PEZI|nr:hypothetical protein B0H63DRAFT_174412 [Podospora didyma]
MADQLHDEITANYEQFREVLSSVLVERLTASPTSCKPRRRANAKSGSKKPVSQPAAATTTGNENNASREDLFEFIEYIASSTFQSLPVSLQRLSHHTWTSSPHIRAQYTLPLTADQASIILHALDPSVTESLHTYRIAPQSPDSASDTKFFPTVLTGYISTTTTPPPAPSSTKRQITACEICQRDWINLTYHHLIPRMVHAKAVKRGWHRGDELQNVAWLCGACHRFVHGFASHEDLARRYYTVKLLLEEPEIEAFASWVGKLRWKGLGGVRGSRRKRGP